MLGVSAYVRTGNAGTVARMADRVFSENEAGDRSSILVETCDACGAMINLSEFTMNQHYAAAHCRD